MAEPFRMLDPKVRSVWLVHGLGAGVVAAAVGAAVAGVAVGRADGSAWWWLLPLFLPAAVVLVTVVGIPFRYRRWRFRFDDDALVIERGSVWWVGSAVPYQRIQQVDLEHGPVMRRFGLVTLRLRTAAAGSLARVPALTAAEAEVVRGELLRRAGRGDGA